MGCGNPRTSVACSIRLTFTAFAVIFMSMAKNDNSNTFGDFSKKIRLSPDRKNLSMVNPKLTFEEYLVIAIKEGHKLLEEEAKNAPKDSVKKTPQIQTKPDSVKLENKLGEISNNPYVKARTEVFKKMNPEARAIIEKMERNELTKDARWDTFCKAVRILGDQLSK